MANSFLKTLVGGWSLERKCLLFLGLALLGSLILAFYAVQVVASVLVMRTTRQSARDYANTVIGWKHISTDFKPLDAQKGTAISPSAELVRTQSPDYRTRVLELLRPYMLPSRYEYEILRIEDFLEHESLPAPNATGKNLERMNRIHAKLAEKDSIAAEEAKQSEEKRRLTVSLKSDPSTPATNSPANGLTAPLADSINYIFEEDRSSDSYFYFHPIEFDKKNCLDECHHKLPSSIATSTTPSLDPYRIIRVKMPYRDTQVWSMRIYAVLTSIAICTLALSLFFIHCSIKELPPSKFFTISVSDM